MPITLGRDLCGDFEQSLRREWLVTNGLGGFGAGTVGGCQTRRYHGLLIAAQQPPVQRTMLLVDLDVQVEVGGYRYDLGSHEYADGTVAPSGHRLIESFTLDGTVPTWRYALGAVRLTKRVYMARGRNTTYVTLSIDRAPSPVILTIRALCSGRDYHWHRRGPEGYQLLAAERGCRVVTAAGAPALALSTDVGEFVEAPDMHWNLRHRAEAQRGLDSVEDLYTPGTWTATLVAGQSIAVTATIEESSPRADAALAELRAHEAGLIATAPVDLPDWARQLVLAADQFIVRRSEGHDPDGGSTVIAGYPWFGDWGRDTMIALPGLTLTTGRAPVAAQILRTFARHVHQGLLPNRFPDAGEAPEYNTVDATLWYFVALHEYLRVTRDISLARELYPKLVEIVDWHRRGTMHGIGVDPKDGLLRAGAPGVQLTWMDAKVGDMVVTPRAGKPVEINALWCNALNILAGIAKELGDGPAARTLQAEAEAATQSFATRFWYADGGYLYDVIDAPDTGVADASLRPNQLLALALPHELVDRGRAASILAKCEYELLTSNGIRTLAPGSTGYTPLYRGGPADRDAAYHQGTVWPWLLGAFARAHFRVFGDSISASAILEPIALHLRDACIGQISEIFDADPPHDPQGCFAQAWSVAEVLRAWCEIRAASRAVPGLRQPGSPKAARVVRTRRASPIAGAST
jgi:predicted glycogen debranching enzyme